MSVINLQPGEVLDIRAGEIFGNVYIYRTNQGYDSPGHVGWLPNGGTLQQVALSVGETASFAINQRAGTIANGCPSKIQVMWDNGNAALSLDANISKGKATQALARANAMVTTAESGSMQQAMETLNAQWYNALTSGLNLDPSTFQLMQGNSVVGSLSETLWSVFNAVPPLSVNNLYNPSQFNSFSSNYGSIINNLNQPGSNQFQNDMGDYYPQWSQFLSTQSTLPSGGIMELFQTWSQLHMPAGQAMQCYTDLANIYQGAVYTAISMWLQAGGSGASVKAYNITVEQVATKLAQAPSGGISMNSKTETSDISHTWAEGHVGGWFDMFSGEGSGSYDDISQSLITSGLQISADFNHVITMAAGPLSQTSDDPILSQYKPWYNAATLNLAYQNNNNVVWKNSPPTWDNMFGTDGSLLRVCSALVLVDGISISISSDATFSQSEQQEIKTHASGGFWPFFEANASGGWSNNFSFDDEGKMTYTATCPVGNPVILGAIVTPIAAATMLS